MDLEAFMKLVSFNPFTGETNAEFESMGFEETVRKLAEARSAWDTWGRLPARTRVRHLEKLAATLRAQKRSLAESITREMGKPITQSLAEIEKCAWLCDYFAEHTERFLQEEIVAAEAPRSYVTFEPLGLILGIMPWNFPFWQVFRFAVPALAAGNVCVLKHASNVPLTALTIENVFRDSGFPEHVCKTLLTDSRVVMRLIEEDLVDGISLTGSFDAGSQVASLAGRLIKKVVLELGGSDPFIVLEEADLEAAARVAVQSRMINSGQSCIAAKRAIVVQPLAEAFLGRMVGALGKLKIGDPMEEDTDIGPLAKKEFVEVLSDQLADALNRGAKVFLGPEPPSGSGFFFRPVVVTQVTPDMRIMKEEVFGPILPVAVAKDHEEAVALANSTSFGLGASIWTRDLGRAEHLARALRVGTVAINDMVKSDPRLPFGGIKRSGVGRELSHYGLREFMNIKAIVVKGT